MKINLGVVWDESGCPAGFAGVDQIREAYIWGNVSSATLIVRVPTECTPYIRLDHEYFLTPRPNYTPFTYPHPLR